MSTEEQYDAASSKEEPASPLSEQLGFGVGTFLAAGALDLVAHFGLTGLVVGGIAAYVASQHGPEVLEQVRGTVPSRPAPTRTRRTAPRLLAADSQRSRQRSFFDRALGRFPDTSEDDTLLVEEEADRPATQTWTGGHPASARRATVLDLSPTLQVPMPDLAGKAIFVCGIRRQGKTTLGALLAEQLGAHGLPLFLPDLEGDYLSLAQVLPRGVIAGHSRADGQYTAHRFAALDSAAAAFQFGADLLEYGYQVILDLSSYTTLDEALAIQINIIRGLFHWTNSHAGQGVPCHIYLDEAQRYLPQNLSDSVILDRTVLGMLLKCYMDIIAIGGKRGLAPVILTQRFAQVNNKIMAQSEVFFLLRQTHDSDLKRCMEYVNSEVATKEQIARFAPGQGVYIASDGSQCVTRFHQRRSSGERSKSPQAEAASRYSHMALPLSRLSARQVEREEVDYWEDQPVRQMTMPPLAPARAEPEEPVPSASRTVLPVPRERKPQPSLQDAISCWNALIEAGEHPSRNQLQQALLAKGFECRENWARKFYEDIKTMLKDQSEESTGG